MLKGGGAQHVLGHFYAVPCSFSHNEVGGGGAKSFHSLKGGGEKFDPILRGGGAKRSGPAILFPFCSPSPSPLSVINDQSLIHGYFLFRAKIDRAHPKTFSKVRS